MIVNALEKIRALNNIETKLCINVDILAVLYWSSLRRVTVYVTGIPKDIFMVRCQIKRFSLVSCYLYDTENCVGRPVGKLHKTHGTSSILKQGKIKEVL